jgi:hypothetical protein
VPGSRSSSIRNQYFENPGVGDQKEQIRLWVYPYFSGLSYKTACDIHLKHVFKLVHQFILFTVQKHFVEAGLKKWGTIMTDKNRTVILGIVIALFILANIIAGIYKYGSTGTTTQKQAAQVDETVETGEQTQEVKAPDAEVKASEPPGVETEARKESEEAVAEAVIEEKSTAQSGEDSKPETGTDQSGQQQIAAYETERSELEKEIVRLQEELRVTQALADENQQLSEQVRESSAERERLQKELAVLQVNNEKYEEISAQNEKLTNQIKAYFNQTNDYKKEISNLQKRIDQYKNLVSENKKLQAQLGDAKRQNDALKVRLDKIRTIVEGE